MHNRGKSAQELVAQFKGASEWNSVLHKTVYLSSQCRVQISVEKDSSFFVFNDEDHEVTGDQATKDIMGSLGDYLCPDMDLRLAKALVSRLIDWEIDRKRAIKALANEDCSEVLQLIEGLRQQYQKRNAEE